MSLKNEARKISTLNKSTKKLIKFKIEFLLLHRKIYSLKNQISSQICLDRISILPWKEVAMESNERSGKCGDSVRGSAREVQEKRPEEWREIGMLVSKSHLLTPVSPRIV